VQHLEAGADLLILKKSSGLGDGYAGGRSAGGGNGVEEAVGASTGLFAIGAIWIVFGPGRTYGKVKSSVNCPAAVILKT